MSNDELTVWGIHTTDDSLFLNGNVVAIGWKEFGDCGELVHTREAFKLTVQRYIRMQRKVQLPSAPVCCIGLLLKSR